MVQVWRIVRTKYGTKSEAFSGKGAAQYPGRWNQAGIPIVYCCSSIALCVLEIFVHVKNRKVLEERYCTFEVRIPKALIFNLQLKGSTDIDRSREIGTNWVREAAFPVMQVPSVITGERNYLLNPQHPDFGKLEIDEAQLFLFDPRLRV